MDTDSCCRTDMEIGRRGGGPPRFPYELFWEHQKAYEGGPEKRVWESFIDSLCAAAQESSATILGHIDAETAKNWLGLDLGPLYVVGYCGSTVFCAHGGFVVILYPPLLENERKKQIQRAAMVTTDDEFLLRRPAEPFTPPVMFTCTLATLVRSISHSHEELTGILGPMVATGRGRVRALNSNYGHYCQPGYERFLKRPKPLPVLRGARKRQGDASCFNSAVEVTIIPDPDDNPPPLRRSCPQEESRKVLCRKVFPFNGIYPGTGCHLPRSVRRFLCRGYLGPLSDRGGRWYQPRGPGHNSRRMADYGELQVPPSPPERARCPQSGPHHRIPENRERIG